MPEATLIPTPGQIARVRQRLYLVEQTVPAPSPGDSTLVMLSCVDDDAQGQRLEVLWEREIDPEIQTGEAWDAIAKRGFDPARTFAAYLNILRWNCVTATDPKLFQSPFRAGIKLDAYQLEPLRKALLLPRVNLFIADDVGLGKTIEALLIGRELLIRKKVREIIIVCPPSMLYQWQTEAESRFGLTFKILDKEYISQVRKERGFGVNPWGTHTRFLVSQRLLIDEGYTGPLLDWLGEFRGGTLLILDEAHHAAPSSGQKYAIDSQITRAVRELAPRFEHRLFLSATPHNGHSNSFSALLEILDPQRFCRGVPVKKRIIDDVMVRRLKDDIREVQGGFPVRHVVQVDIDGLPPDAPELRLSALLDQYRALREQRLSGESRRKQAAAGLLISGLQQRLLSSIEAFARTLRVHRRTVLRQWEAAQAGNAGASAEPAQIELLAGSVGNDDDLAALAEVELQAEEDAQVAAASAATAGPLDDAGARQLFAGEQKLLDEMTEIAETARSRPDARVRKIIDWIRANMCPDLSKPGARWTDIRVIFFTEYDDTKRYLRDQISAVIEGSDRAGERIAIYHGPTPPDERREIQQAFTRPPAKYPVRILIATDAAREGLNLQSQCWNLFHFDVPWNPSRMEQRNGRIDRKLQEHEVYCHYFVYKQRPEDRILAALVRKTDTIKLELGSLAQVIEERLADQMRLGIRRDRIADMEKDIREANLAAEASEAVSDELEATRQRQDALREQIDRLRTQLKESERDIGLSEDHFRAAISCALEMMGAEKLKKADDESEGPGRFTFPALDQRQGADPTWVETMDALRVPKERGQKPWEWRRESPIRPVVFQDSGKMDDSIVHLHLEHRVVRRLLGRFVAQGFVYHDLSRACLAQTSDAIPRVILLGRLCLYGPGAARLHEDIIPITARWTDPKVRKAPLSPYAQEAEAKTMDLLQQSLLLKSGQAVTATIERQLQACAPQDVQELLPYLGRRGEEYAADAQKKLRERADAEAKAMREILQMQQKHIAETAARVEKGGPPERFLPGFLEVEVERRQLEANKRHWTRRLTTIEEELKTEPDRIREVYEVKATRVEPVGLVYLWPVTG